MAASLTRRKRILFGLVLVVATLVLMLALGEGVLRLMQGSPEGADREARIHDFFSFDETGCFRIEPGSSGWHRPYEGRRGILVHVNSAGLRGPELRAGEHARIAFVGDSITFDGGVEWDDGFVALIEKQLSVDGSVECLNFGTTDAGIVQYELKVRHHVSQLRVDAVVVGLYLNDARPPQGFLGESSQAPWETALRGSAAYDLLTVQALHRKWRAARYGHDPAMLRRFRWIDRFRAGGYRTDEAQWREMVEEARFDWGAAWRDDSWPPIETGLAAIADLCERRGIPLLVVAFPVKPQVEITAPYADLDLPQERIAAITAALDVPMLDLLPALRARRTEALFNDQCHLTALGNRVVAESMAPWLQQALGWVGVEPPQGPSLGSGGRLGGSQPSAPARAAAP